MNERDYLLDRLQKYFQHPDFDHEYLTIGDRATACRNLRDVFAWLNVPGARGTRADDADAEFFDTDLDEQVKAFQQNWDHPIRDGKVGPNTRSRLLQALLQKFDISTFRRLKKNVKPTVFISYARADSERVNKLDQWLRDHGVRVIRDVSSFQAGTKIQDNVLRSVLLADKVIAVYSEQSKTRDWPSFEHQIAEQVESVIKEPVLIYLRLDDTQLRAHDPNRIAVQAQGKTLKQIGVEIQRSLDMPIEPARFDYDEDAPL
jgi:hypothetical protein